MDQAKKTEAATDQYDDAVARKAPADVVKNLHDVKAWEETKSYVCGHATTEAANKAIAEQNQSKPK